MGEHAMDMQVVENTVVDTVVEHMQEQHAAELRWAVVIQVVGLVTKRKQLSPMLEVDVDHTLHSLLTSMLELAVVRSNMSHHLQNWNHCQSYSISSRNFDSHSSLARFAARMMNFK